MPKSYIDNELKGFILFTLFSMILLIGSIVFAVNITSKKLTNRLTHLINTINTDISNWKEWEHLDEINDTDDEFRKITRKFKEHSRLIHNYYDQINQYEMANKALELNLLQERINPHFLYNTLSTFKWVCGNPQLEQTIESMVNYYRIALNKGNVTLKIKQEIEMIREYVSLQKFAYRLDMKFTLDVDEEMMEGVILKQLLQPIVENAILHGILGLEEGGELTITGRLQNDEVVLKVIDNGIGMPAEKIEQIISGTNQNLYNGYGMKNIQDRISIYYGNIYGIKIESIPMKGTTVTLTLPYRFS